MHSERFEFPGALGHTLSARLDQPDDAARAVALYAHCFTCGKDVLAARRIAKALAEQGIAVLRFDFTGIGASGGEFADTNFSANVGDLLAAADFLRARGQAPALLVGHSLGGTACIEAARRIPEARAVVTIGAPSEPAFVRDVFGDHVGAIEEHGEATVPLDGRPFRVTRQMLADAGSHRVAESAARLGRALLVLHSPLDATVPIEHAFRIFSAARHPKSFVSLDTADHLLTGRDDAAWAAGLIAAWSARYLSD
jgi:putative redox protein